MTHTDQPARRQSPSPRLPEGDTPAPDGRSAPAEGRAGPRAGFSPAVARQIDENLRLLYRRQVEQELPEELRVLVARLRASDGNGSGGTGNGAEGDRS